MIRKIGTKIILSIAICTTLTAVLVGGTSLYKSREVVKQESREKLSYMAKSNGGELTNILENTEKAVDSLGIIALSQLDQSKLNDPMYLHKYESEIDAYVKYFSEQTKRTIGSYVYLDISKVHGLYGVWYADNQGSAQYVKQDLGDIATFDPLDSTMAWYYKPIQEGQGVWSEPYIDQDLKINMITYSKPIVKDGQTIGVVGMDINFDLFKNAVSSIKVYKTGFAYILDNQFQFLIHPSFTSKDSIKTVENGALKGLATELEQRTAGILDYTLQGQKKVLSYYKLENGWYLVISPTQKEIEEGINSISIWIIGIIACAILLTIVVGGIIARNISKPVNHLANAMKDVASGNLTHVFSRTSNDEIGLLTETFNTMSQNLREMIQYMRSSAEQVSRFATELHTSAEETSQSIGHITTSIQGIADGSEEQMNRINNGKGMMATLEDIVNDAVVNAQEVAQTSVETSNLALNGNLEVKTAVTQMNSIQLNISELARVISELKDRSQRIGDIVEIIANIAGRTNLLALNASIEAARAGEQGKGFSVVAEEVKKLAEQSTQSAREIREYISMIQHDILQAAASMETSTQEVESGIEVVNKVGMTFGNIQNAIDKVTLQLGEVSTATKEISASINLTTAIHQLEEVSQTTSLLMEKVTASSEVLSEMANGLMQETSKFKL
ncbi:methyl-accepting chemotaxis protein [Paenibacillus sp. sgz500958]|uniref:methyl-accepting chemotaxis protein n=1 Tax=Paenibacillus sp. sgz500958 TaxID=3242475 RepID=UPI0036D27E06